VVAEHLGLDWHQAHTDARLVEIGVGSWGGRSYAEIDGVLDQKTGLLTCAPDGEAYHEIADRVSRWLADTDGDPGDRLIVMHGISSRVLRGVMTGLPEMPSVGAPIAPALPQGSVVMIEDGVETVIHRGSGKAPA
jgi:probable phosphoglycerate mutase